MNSLFTGLIWSLEITQFSHFELSIFTPVVTTHITYRTWTLLNAKIRFQFSSCNEIFLPHCKLCLSNNILVAIDIVNCFYNWKFWKVSCKNFLTSVSSKKLSTYFRFHSVTKKRLSFISYLNNRSKEKLRKDNSVMNFWPLKSEGKIFMYSRKENKGGRKNIKDKPRRKKISQLFLLPFAMWWKARLWW